MREIVAKPLPHAESTLTFDEGYPPLAPTDGNRAAARALRPGAAATSAPGRSTPSTPIAPAPPTSRSSPAHVKMVLDGIGLMGHSDHTPQETADLTTLPSQTKRAALLLHRLGQGAAGL